MIGRKGKTPDELHNRSFIAIAIAEAERRKEQ